MPRRRREISINAQISTDTDLIWLKLVKLSTSLILVGASIISNNLNYSLAVISIFINELLSISKKWKPFYHTSCLSDLEASIERDNENRNLIQNPDSVQTNENGNLIRNDNSIQTNNLAENQLSTSVHTPPRSLNPAASINPTTNSSQTRNACQNNLQTHLSTHLPNIPKVSIKSFFKQTLKNTSVSTLIRISLYICYVVVWFTANDQNGMFFITLTTILLCTVSQNRKKNHWMPRYRTFFL